LPFVMAILCAQRQKRVPVSRVPHTHTRGRFGVTRQAAGGRETGRAMLQNLSEEICECLHRAEECKRLSQTALTPSAIKDYLEMEQRWLALARSYEFAQRLSRFTKAAQEAKKQPRE